jgi:hypothetical protein
MVGSLCKLVEPCTKTAAEVILLWVQLDSDDENEARNVAAATTVVPPAADAQLDPSCLEDAVELQASEDPDPERQGGAQSSTLRRHGGIPGVKMTEDYRAWISVRKAAWRAHRQEARRQRGATGGGAAATQGAELPGVGVLGGGMQRQMAATMHATWHVLQVRSLLVARSTGCCACAVSCAFTRCTLMPVALSVWAYNS